MLAFLTRRDSRLRRWEGIMLAGLALVVLLAGSVTWRQGALAQRLVRLHVVANSDSDADQALKLRVRDAVLDRAQTLLQGAESTGEALEILSANLEPLARAGQQVVTAQGYSYPVTASLEQTEFPTKYYDGFALPAGEYQALRVVIGSGEGQNWWCVVFPSLCTAPVSDLSETAMAAGLTQDDVGLMTEENGGYVLQFKCMEWWNAFRAWAGV